MTRRESRVPAFLLIALSMCVAVSACSTSDTEPESGGVPPGYVSKEWVEREVMLHILDRMLTENDPEEKVETITGSQNPLFESHVLNEDEDGHFIEFDKDEWDNEEVPLHRVDVALVYATNFDEVTWCGEPVGGRELREEYMEEFWDTLDSHEEYTASIADYVDCGDGRV